MTLVYKWIFIPLSLCLNAAFADNECDENTFQIIGNHVNIQDYKSRNEEGVVVAESCKIWPYRPSVTLVAFAHEVDSPNDAQLKDMIVAMIDNRKNQIISSIQTTVGEDAFTEIDNSSLKLDTARYQLSNKIREFGLRFHSSARGASCGEANWGNQLTLFVPEGKKLRPMLSVYMYQQKSIKGCLSVFSPDAVWENAEVSLSMKKTFTNGLADILVTAKILPDFNESNTENIKARTETYTLQFDGHKYVTGSKVPWWLNFYNDELWPIKENTKNRY